MQQEKSEIIYGIIGGKSPQRPTQQQQQQQQQQINQTKFQQSMRERQRIGNQRRVVNLWKIFELEVAK